MANDTQASPATPPQDPAKAPQLSAKPAAMKRVRMRRLAAGPTASYEVGEEYELPAAVADAWVKNGSAELAK